MADESEEEIVAVPVAENTEWWGLTLSVCLSCNPSSRSLYLVLLSKLCLYELRQIFLYSLSPGLLFKGYYFPVLLVAVQAPLILSASWIRPCITAVVAAVGFLPCTSSPEVLRDLNVVHAYVMAEPSLTFLLQPSVRIYKNTTLSSRYFYRIK